MEIKAVGVVGFGTMGSGIAQVTAQSGYEVVILEKNEELFQKGFLSINSFLTKGVEKGKISEQDKNSTLSRINAITKYEDFHSCDLVIEAVHENIDLKKEIFAKLDKACHKNTILASNTSSLSIIDMASVTKRPEKVLGLHFMNPVPLMKLLEIVKSVATEKRTIEICKKFAESLGKTIIVAKDTPGFIVNYLQYPFRLNAIRMLERGLASKEDIDTAARLALGHPIGPLELQDMVGLDVTYAGSMAVYEETGDPNFLPPVLMKKMISAGWLGRKVGKGFYEYKEKRSK